MFSMIVIDDSIQLTPGPDLPLLQKRARTNNASATGLVADQVSRNFAATNFTITKLIQGPAS